MTIGFGANVGDVTVHTYPLGDLIEHDTEKGSSCLCGPRTEVSEMVDDDTPTGAYHFHVIHHSFDGREFAEPDYQGPPMPRDVI